MEISENICSGMTLTFELDGAKMVFPLINFFIHKVSEKRKKGYFFKNSNDYSEFCFYILGSCFDFHIDGDKSIIGFKKTQNSYENCSVESTK